MPKVSKVKPRGKAVSSKPAQFETPTEDRIYKCTRCGKEYTKQRFNFPPSQSPLFVANNKYLPICYDCIDKLYDHYKEVLNDTEAALIRLCMKLDYYWSPDVLASVRKRPGFGTSTFRKYISRLSSFSYTTKTYDNTIDEMSLNGDGNEIVLRATPTVEAYDDDVDIKEQVPVVTPEVVNFWGAGFTPSMYMELENRRNYWMSQYPNGTELSLGEEALLRQICKIEVTINQDMAAGKPIEKSVNTLNSLLGSMNIKPSQIKESDDTYIPFGLEIAKWEDEHPVIEPDEEFRDVDNIHKNVISWFLGSLCKTAGIKNEYSDMFEEEMAKYTVERPKFADDEYDDIDEDGDDDGEEV